MRCAARRIGLVLSFVVLSGLLWGAIRAFQDAAGLRTFAHLPDHDYLGDIEVLRQQGKLTEALALSQFVCDQPAYPQRAQACRLSQHLGAQTRTFWYRAHSLGLGALTGTAANGWALAGATAADFLVVGDVRDLFLQGWRRWHGQDADELLMALSAVGILSVTLPSLDWVPAFGKTAIRRGALSERFLHQLTLLGKRAVATRTLVPLHGLFRDMHHLVWRLGAAKALRILPIVDNTEDLATVAHLAATHPQKTYGLLKVGGRQALDILANAGPEAAPDLLRAARKGVPGLRVLQRFGRRMFHSHLFVGASKALHRGRLPQAMSWWLATQTSAVHLLVTAVLGGAWLTMLRTLWHTWRSRG